MQSWHLLRDAMQESRMYNDVEANIWEGEQVKLWDSAQEMIFKAVFLDSFTSIQNCLALLVSTIENIRRLVKGVDLTDERARLAFNEAERVLTKLRGVEFRLFYYIGQLDMRFGKTVFGVWQVYIEKTLSLILYSVTE